MAVVVYMLAKALPRVSDDEEVRRGPNFFDRLMAKLPLSTIDARLNTSLAKLLRKFRVVVMKVDNFINDRLGKLNKKAPAAKPEDPSQDQNKSVL